MRGLADATGTPELPRQAAEEMSLSFPVGIDQKADTAAPKRHQRSWDDLVQRCPRRGSIDQITGVDDDYVVKHRRRVHVAPRSGLANHHTHEFGQHLHSQEPAKGEYQFTCSAKGMINRSRTILIGADLPQVNVDVALSKN